MNGFGLTRASLSRCRTIWMPHEIGFERPLGARPHRQRTKKEAAAVLGAMGLTLSDAFRLLVKRIAAERAGPFEPLVPNEKTIAAMREAPAGKLTRFNEREGSAAGTERRRLHAPVASSAITGARNPGFWVRNWIGF